MSDNNPTIKMNVMDEQTRIELEAATFRRLLQHLQTHTEVQNIDLMILADFCRNCLAKWYSAAASERGLEFDYPTAQEIDQEIQALFPSR